MSALERKVVHEHLKDRHDVETYSEGQEPDRAISSSLRSSTETGSAPRSGAFHVFLDGETRWDGVELRGWRSSRTSIAASCRPAGRRGLVRGRRQAAPGDAAHAHPPRGALPLAGGALPELRLYGPYHHGGRSYYQWMARGRALVQDLLPLLEADSTPSSTATPPSGSTRCASATPAHRARARRRGAARRPTRLRRRLADAGSRALRPRRRRRRAARARCSSCVADDPRRADHGHRPRRMLDDHLADSLVALELARGPRRHGDRRPRRRRRASRACRSRSRCPARG